MGQSCGRSIARSLDGNELGTSGGTDTDFTVTNGFVSHGVLTEVITNHVSSDLDGVPVLARVNLADGTDHLGHDDGISEMSLDGCGLLAVGGILDGLGELLDKTVVTGVDSASESSAGSGPEHGHDFLGGEFEKLIELDTSVNLLFECFSLLGLRSLGSGKSFLDRGHI